MKASGSKLCPSKKCPGGGADATAHKAPSKHLIPVIMNRTADPNHPKAIAGHSEGKGGFGSKGVAESKFESADVNLNMKRMPVSLLTQLQSARSRLHHVEAKTTKADVVVNAVEAKEEDRETRSSWW